MALQKTYFKLFSIWTNPRLDFSIILLAFQSAAGETYDPSPLYTELLNKHTVSLVHEKNFEIATLILLQPKSGRWDNILGTKNDH